MAEFLIALAWAAVSFVGAICLAIFILWCIEKHLDNGRVVCLKNQKLT